MRRSAARCRIASRSPGRRRIVIRSTAGPLDLFAGKSRMSESSKARMEMSASVDSDICRLAAIAANKRFSSGVGRAVIDGAVDLRVPSFTARAAADRGHIAILPSLQYRSDNTPRYKRREQCSCSHELIEKVQSLLSVGPTRSSAGLGGRTKGVACISQQLPRPYRVQRWAHRCRGIPNQRGNRLRRHKASTTDDHARKVAGSQQRV
jgi:hypothetical protein